MQNGVPERENDIKCPNLAENFCGIDKQQNNDFQRVGQVNLQPALDKGGQREQNQRQHAEHHVFKVSVEHLGNEHHHHRNAQQDIQRRDQALVFHGAELCAGFFFLFHEHLQSGAAEVQRRPVKGGWE